MKIGEVEEMLGITRANIRYYEKEGLFSVERKENKYREYSDDDISVLKKIIVLRKLGVPVEDIRALFRGEKDLGTVLDSSIEALQTELEGLKGSLNIAKRLEAEGKAEFDEDQYFELILREEKDGKKFIDLCKDIWRVELNILDDTLKYLFGYDYKKHRKNAGAKVATVLLIGYLLLFGLGNQGIFGKGFFETVAFPLRIFFYATVICFPILFVKEKYPKLAKGCYKAIVILEIGLLLLLAFVLIGTVVDSYI